MPENFCYGNENAFATPSSSVLSSGASKHPRPVIKPIHILLMLFSFSWTVFASAIGGVEPFKDLT
jgi:hypothetical protein